MISFSRITEDHGDMEVQYVVRDGVLIAELFKENDTEPLEMDVSYEKAAQVISTLGYDPSSLRKLGNVDPVNTGSPYGYWVMQEVLT